MALLETELAGLAYITPIMCTEFPAIRDLESQWQDDFQKVINEPTYDRLQSSCGDKTHVGTV